MNNPLLTKSLIAEGAAAPYRIIAHGTGDGKAKQATAATDALFGITGTLGAADGERVDVHVVGPVEVEYGGVVTRGDPLTSDANGKAIAVTRHTHTENTAAAYTQNATTGAGSDVRIIGFAAVSGALGDIGSVSQIAPGLA